MPAQKPGPSRNVQSWKATSVCPAIASVGRHRRRRTAGAGSAPPSTLTMPGDDDRRLDDAQRDVAERGAVAVALGERVQRDRRCRCCRSRSGSPGARRAVICVSCAAAEDVVGVIEQRAVEQEAGDREERTCRGTASRRGARSFGLKWCMAPRPAAPRARRRGKRCCRFREPALQRWDASRRGRACARPWLPCTLRISTGSSPVGPNQCGSRVSNSATSPGRIVMSCSPRISRISPEST